MDRTTSNLIAVIDQTTRGIAHSKTDIRTNLARAAQDIARILADMDAGRVPHTCDTGNILTRVQDADRAITALRTAEDLLRAFAHKSLLPPALQGVDLRDTDALVAAAAKTA